MILFVVVEGVSDARWALLGGLIDHAPTFPPARLPTAEALAEDRRARAGAEAWLLGRLVWPSSRLAELAGYHGAPLSLVLDGPVPAAGRAASRVEAFIYSRGTYANGGYPDIDELFLQQAKERDPAKREAILHKIQQLTIDRAMFLPIMDFRTLRGVGPRVAEHALDAMPLNPFPLYEEIKLKP